MPSELENALARHRRALLAREREAASDMVRVYGESWTRLRNEAMRLHAQMAIIGPPTLNQVMRDQRLQSLQAQIEAELRMFAPYATQQATVSQQEAVQAAQANAIEAIQAAGAPNVSSQFDRLNKGAVQNLVGFASDGSPLRELFDAIAPDIAPRVTETLAKGIALGWSPRVTAREMRRDYGLGLTRALTIARTETLRAYRETSHVTYEAHSNVVEGWIWVASISRRTCASCIAMHGSFHPLSERLNDHPNGRCAPAPKVKGRPSRIGAPGSERFAELSTDDQRHILGKGMFDAWKDGRVELTPSGSRSIVSVSHSPRWGDIRVPRSLASVPELPPPSPAPVVKVGPSASPIGKYFLNVPTTGKVAAAVNDGIKAIEAVHGVDTMKPVPFKTSSGEFTTGYYKFQQYGGQPHSLSVSTKSTEPRMTFLHEAGHYVDQQNFVVAKNLTNTGRDRNILHDWRDAVEGSKAIQELNALRRGDAKITGASGKTYSADRQFTNYLLQHNEIWARSYAQYIALRSGDVTTKAELDAIRKHDAGTYPTQWDDDDFEPIAKAFDELFAGEGWRE